MQVRHVPFLHELSSFKSRTLACSAALSKVVFADALMMVSVPVIRNVKMAVSVMSLQITTCATIVGCPPFTSDF